MRPWIPLAAVLLALSPLLVVHPVRVSGRSMEPAMKDGDLRWALRAWASAAPRRGEVWVVEGPRGSSVKRVLGLQGDTVNWRGPDLWINGARLDEPWVIHPERSGEGEATCSEGYLVLGDNRPESQDGRVWGVIPLKALRGRILIIRGAGRWERAPLPIQRASLRGSKDNDPGRPEQWISSAAYQALHQRHVSLSAMSLFSIL